MKYVSIFFIILNFGCSDPIDLKLNNEVPNLVIEASIDWIDGTSGSNQEIKLSLSSDYYTNSIIPATGAIVSIEDSSGTLFNFIDVTNDGIYSTSSFVPVLNETYDLKIIYDSQTYVATETLLPVSQLQNITLTPDSGFSGNELEIRVQYNDPDIIDNFYFFKYKNSGALQTVLEVSDDEFSQGNLNDQIFFEEQEDLSVGDVITISVFGVSNRYYSYINKIITQGQNSPGPFQTTPTAVKGNCINTSRANAPAYGYFRLSQSNSIQVTIN